MTTISLSIPDDVRKVMDKHKKINWNKIAAQAIWDHAKQLELMNKLVSNSKLTEKDAIEIGRKIKTEVARRHGFCENSS